MLALPVTLFSLAVSKNHWQSNIKHKGDVLQVQKNKKERKKKKNIHPIKKYLLLVANDSCLQCSQSPYTFFFSINVHTSASIAETGNEQPDRIITSDGILLNEIIA